ncbi:MAG: hypothetical protein TU36_000025 [Vulcanisaeta sp. AZ3]
MMCTNCEEVHWRLVDLGVDHACGLVCLLRVIGGRIGIIALPSVMDVMVSNDTERVKNALGGSVVVERSLVPNLSSRAILIGSAPYASLEDLIVSVVVNEQLTWYVELVRELLSIGNVREGLRWGWINEVLDRYGVKRKFLSLISP